MVSVEWFFASTGNNCDKSCELFEGAANEGW